jgi:branched-chain amino acid transport system substrate-binding protein
VLRKDAVGVIAGVLLLLLAGCTESGSEQDGGEIVIAASLELTGTAADLGITHERALRLRVDQLNAGGTLGGRKIRLIIADNRTESGEAQTQVTRWAADKSVSAIIVGGCSECGMAAVNIANDKGVPTVSLSAATEVSDPVGSRRFMFRVGPNVPDNARTIMGELLAAQVKTLGIVTQDDAYGANGRTVMTQEAERAGIKINGTGIFAPNAVDQSVAVAAAVGGVKPPDAVVVWAFPVQAGQTASALRNAGYRGRLYFDGAAAGNLFLTGAATASDGASIVFTQTLAMDDVIATSPAKAAQKQWFEDYTSRYGSYHGQASFAADALQLIVNAAIQGGPGNRSALRDALETSQAEGLSGPVRFTPANHSGLMPQALTVLVARSGRWRLLG